MKNKFIILLGFLFTLLFSACDPLEDEIDAAEAANNAVKPAVALDLTLASDDYGFFGGDIEDNSGFWAIEDARTMIPDLFANNYPQAGANSSINATFDVFFFDPADYADGYVTIHRSTEVSEQEYADLGFTFGNFSNPADLDTYMKFKYPNGVITDDTGETITTIKQTTAIELTYLYWNGSAVEERTNPVYYMDGAWKLADYELTDTDYDAMGNGNFDNFGSPEEALNDIPIYMADLYKFDPTPRTMISFQYKQWTGSFVATRLNFFAFDGTSGSVFPGKLTFTESFGYNTTKAKWEGDNTIKYALTTDDYASIAATAIADGTANNDTALLEAGENLERFGNFNLFDWTEAMMITGIGTRLNENFPSAEEGQKYLVSYDFYNGASGNTTIKLIKNSEGNYIKFTE